ncbi:MAG: S1C family serine protease, partial [Luminiphilus sp.]
MIFRTLLCVLALSLTAQKSLAELPDFTEIVDSASPAVVKILVEYESENSRYQEQMEELPESLKRFFDFRGRPPVPRDRAGMGSGFILTSDGYIVTNNHVVENARQVIVRLPDRQEFDAEVIGTDPRSDLAVLKIDAKRLPTLELASEDDIKVGQWVLAIGSPFSLDFSVTAGIVSALGRSLPTETGDNYVPFIQTDVAINPGNSGGPLFNLDGEVIGVNSQIFTRSGGSIGLSFAIPVSVVRNVVSQIQENGVVERGWLGVSIQDVDRNLAESFGLDRPRGALIAQVGRDSPAERAGLQSGDVIVAF